MTESSTRADGHAGDSLRREHAALTGPLHLQINQLKDQLAKREAMLCAVIAALETNGSTPAVFALIDEHAAGTSSDDIVSWHRNHQQEIRDQQDRARDEQAARRQQVLAKLTADELVLLGLSNQL